MRDYEIWMAMHDDCPPDGCGKCVPLEVDWTPEQMRQIEAAARLLGEPFDVFIAKALDSYLRREAVT